MRAQQLADLLGSRRENIGGGFPLRHQGRDLTESGLLGIALGERLPRLARTVGRLTQDQYHGGHEGQAEAEYEPRSGRHSRLRHLNPDAPAASGYRDDRGWTAHGSRV